jgi:hypothetical protein
MAVVLPPVNEVIDLHSMHLAMARRIRLFRSWQSFGDGGNQS